MKLSERNHGLSKHYGLRVCSNRPAVSHTPSPAPATDRDAIRVDRNNIVKLEKMSCPKFTGSPRDFAQWKREFEALVMVPGRSDIEIGGNLLHAIPQKHQRLINHLQLANHKEMMEVLALEFGRSRLVVDDIVGQIEKMKPITTDKAFLEFVEKMEKINVDLTTLGKIQAVANPRELSNLEKKLPTLININWQ